MYVGQYHRRGAIVYHVTFLFLQVKEFLERFDSIPDMLELDHLTVSGDVTFGKGVSLKVSSGCPLSHSHSTFCFLSVPGHGDHHC